MAFWKIGAHFCALRLHCAVGSRRFLHRASILSSVQVKMPSLSPTMQEGQIVKWNKAEGEAVSAGDVLCDIQTDKAVVSLESDEDGTMARIIKGELDGTIKIGTVIAIMAEEDEDWELVAKTATEGDGAEEESTLSASSAGAAQTGGGSTPGNPIKMPALSPTMTEGTIVKWCHKEGDPVSAGEVLCEIQTDKAVVSVEADDDVVLAKILVSEGSQNVKIGTLIALTVNEGDDWKDVQIPSEASESPAARPPSIPIATGGSTPGTEIKMPALSPTMTEGTLVKWCHKEGDSIGAGEVLCEIQTDKAVVSVEVDDDAVLAKIMVPEGTSGIQLGTLIALTVNEGDDWRDVRVPGQEQAGETTTPTVVRKSVPEPGRHSNVPGVGPAANLLLAQYGIDPSALSASGPKGLTKADVLVHVHRENLKPVDLSAQEDAVQEKKVKRPDFTRPASATRATMAFEAPSGRSGAAASSYTDVPLSNVRSVIAKRLVASKQTSPHGHATAVCGVDALKSIRRDFLEGAGLKISMNDLVIKAASAALQCVPEVNLNAVGEDDFRIMPNVDISVAVATPNGLITPIVKGVPSLAVDEISSTVRELAARAREGKLQLDEFQGGTFTISNLGMFGVKEFTAIINPPQCAILAVGAGIDEIDPVTMRPTTCMRATLSFDRRFIDERLASEFMSTFKKIVENPGYMNMGPVPIVRQSARSSAHFN